MRYFKAVVLVAAMFMSFMSAPVYAQDPPPTSSPSSGIWGACNGSTSAVCKDKSAADDVVKRVINLMLFVIGILAVIMIIHSGLKYVSSRGDAEMVKSAKNTLLYAVIGLIVAALSFTIVNFVLEAFK